MHFIKDPRAKLMSSGAPTKYVYLLPGCVMVSLTVLMALMRGKNSVRRVPSSFSAQMAGVPRRRTFVMDEITVEIIAMKLTFVMLVCEVKLLPD